ncbi:MAG: glycosyltransferase family 2 protein [Bacteroidetes bacterium]|nr:glycosyltransferase family 2 protein [Bacteroidota bacterium]
MEITILMPCLNESETLAICINKAQRFLKENKISGEVLIADNGSTDNSIAIALKEGAKVVTVEEKGYGSALITGINSAAGKYIIMGDADDSYDFYHLEGFVDKLRNGNDLVMGNRFKGGIKKGAMPFLHRYVGNPVLSFIGRVFFNSIIKDFHCGLRGFHKERIKKLGLITPGMEFASEMVVKATILNYRMAEVPIILHADGRSRSPHLNTWRDGWRHLVFLLMYSPKWLFFFPSIFILLISLAGLSALLTGTQHIFNLNLDIHTLTLAGSMVVLSYQLFLFAIFIRIYSVNQGYYPAKKKHMLFFKIFTLERGIVIGFMLLLFGIVIFTYLIGKWYDMGFGEIKNVSSTFKLLIPSITLISIGIQTIFASFLFRILGINPKIYFPNEGT